MSRVRAPSIALALFKNMTIWQAFILGLIQGITEFLPISSSGHLALCKYCFGFEHLQDYIFFDLICHLGTLLAIFLILFPKIRDKAFIHFKDIVLGTLPLFPIVFVFKPIKALFDKPELLGPCFIASAALLFTSIYWRLPFKNSGNSWKDPLTIGALQAVAILPGISRSGATISAARLLGWDKEQAILFSFSLAVPAILGGSILEGWQAWHQPSNIIATANPWIFFVGFFTSFVIGAFSLKILIWMVSRDKWIYFGWYCLLLGCAVTFYFI